MHPMQLTVGLPGAAALAVVHSAVPSKACLKLTLNIVTDTLPHNMQEHFPVEEAAVPPMPTL
jgi:hypothetical protein